MSAVSNVTKEGIEVKPGQVWRDLDKRNLHQRSVIVRTVGNGYASCDVLEDGKSTPRASRLAIRRMHKTTTGWALVSEAV